MLKVRYPKTIGQWDTLKFIIFNLSRSVTVKPLNFNNGSLHIFLFVKAVIDLRNLLHSNITFFSLEIYINA